MKTRVLCGFSLLLVGILLMFVPLLIHLQGHPTMRHAIIVLGAVCVLLSYPFFIHRTKD